MISIKKHIESWRGPAAADPALRTCRALLLAAGESTDRAVPDLGPTLGPKLSALAESLLEPVTPELLANVSQTAENELSKWAEAAFLRHEASERDLRQVVEVLAKAIESVTERDQRYVQEVGDLTQQLRSIAGMTDISAISHALLESANSLTACVERINEDSRHSLHRLSTEVEDYRARLVKSEKLSCIDPLTGLANRRCFEDELSAKIRAANRFCLILIDLNGFKDINDRFGHLTGDEVLKHFAGELQRQFPSADLVARWGGDEFAVIITSSQKDAEARMHRIRRSVLGEYIVKGNQQPVAVMVDASIGVVEWQGSESGPEMLARVDRCMYLGKEAMRTVRPV